MRRDLQALSGKEYDLIIVGGGIFGACAAWDAALRGLSTILLEKGDFCGASSANHLKMVHGGIRYLQHADLPRIRESCHERSTLLRIAPHLVRPLPVVIPTYGHGIKGKIALGVAFFLYDLITIDRNKGIRDPDRQIPGGRFISQQEILRLFPGLEIKNLTGGAIFYDGQMYNPPRLTISFLRSAADEGAAAANYVEVRGLLKKRNKIVGVKARDIFTGSDFEILSRVVLITAGAWSHRLLEQQLGIQLNPKPVYSRDLAFVVNRKLTNKYGFAIPLKTKDSDSILNRGGRHLFVVPWRDYCLVGVWHKVFNKTQEEIGVSEEELQGFIDEANQAYSGFALTLEDVSMILTGLTLFGDERKQEERNLSFGKRSRLIDHGREHGMEGLVTLLGVRATTARGMAEKALDLILRMIGSKWKRSNTSVTPIYGGQITCFKDFLKQAMEQKIHGMNNNRIMRALIHNYGSKYQEVLKYTHENPSLIMPIGDSLVIKAEVIHAIREEMAHKLGDVVFRRTDLGTGAFPGEQALRTCADLMANELGWDKKKIQAEFEEVMTTFRRRGFLNRSMYIKEFAHASSKLDHAQTCPK
ncbi:MAG: glycerol-3-phosphate dehydrogenase/oxidase [Nitrospirota bacterium]